MTQNAVNVVGQNRVRIPLERRPRNPNGLRHRARPLAGLPRGGQCENGARRVVRTEHRQARDQRPVLREFKGVAVIFRVEDNQRIVDFEHPIPVRVPFILILHAVPIEVLVVGHIEAVVDEIAVRRQVASGVALPDDVLVPDEFDPHVNAGLARFVQ